ncbi:uncharacterized protein LOC114527386 [Dendronephthya gigantea]|uniref:uncharacterized protein LOC114527386 n=1 Tax=Dendronephthya gigantea TaxID=151771 RepID=UPI00106B8720|nr:uncharacterized protein LOC114527386 [Dendronephthya gigantea]
MAAGRGERIRNSEWEDDEALEADLKRYVMQNLTRREVLDFVKHDFPHYAWNLGTLSRRLAYFDIKYVRYDIDVQEVENIVREEIEGPGQLLGYRAMQKKLREVHNLAVPRGLVHNVMGIVVDPDGLERRGNVGVKKRRRGAMGTFTSLGSNHTHSGDGHDKLMGFMNDTFPLAVYGVQDVFSGYIVYLKLWNSNSDPKLIGRWYLENLYNTRVISNHLRLDKGTETGQMATIHAFLMQYNLEEVEDVSAGETVHYGPSTNNKIERWWRELHHRLEKYFKRQLLMLLEEGHYEPDNQRYRDLLAFVFIPIIAKEMSMFRETIWNSHRVRCQKDARMPKGIPNHLYAFPEEYGAEQCGFPVSKEALDEVAELSGVMTVGDDFLTPNVRAECERIIPEINAVKPNDTTTAYLFLKTHYQQSSSH